MPTDSATMGALHAPSATHSGRKRAGAALGMQAIVRHFRALGRFSRTFPASPDFAGFQRAGAPGNARHIRLFPAISGRMMRPEIGKRSGSLGSVGFVSAKRHPLRSERGASRTVAHHSGPSDGGRRGYLPRRAERVVGRRPVDFATESGPSSGIHFRAQPSGARYGHQP